ncbi:hypothetical protein [Streptomyces sp. NPDC007083]|uniref:hypothetical protein n=1 Tax=unclassified Streptomyces TaxID=2593676 RepID=UPI003411A768
MEVADLAHTAYQAITIRDSKNSGGPALLTEPEGSRRARRRRARREPHHLTPGPRHALAEPGAVHQSRNRVPKPTTAWVPLRGQATAQSAGTPSRLIPKTTAGPHLTSRQVQPAHFQRPYG